jgi:hypothetical protein
LCADPNASTKTIAQIALERGAIEQGFHDAKEVERIEQVQLPFRTSRFEYLRFSFSPPLTILISRYLSSTRVYRRQSIVATWPRDSA